MSPSPKPIPTNRYTIFFIMALSFVCALILSLMASALRGPQEIAEELDRSGQMMMAARILSPEGYFQIDEKGDFVPAKLEQGIHLVATTEDPTHPDRRELFEMYRERIVPMLVNRKGELSTFEKQGIDQAKYIDEHRKVGYYTLPWMLIYKVLPNPEAGQKPSEEGKAAAWVIPVNGYGLWDAIYGYLALSTNGDTVIGISWYDQKETPGLGAVITEPGWQEQFHGKLIFEEGPDGKTDFETAPLGLTVVRGKVENVIGDKPKAKSSIDGIPGATLTGNGVTSAYHDVLKPYRAFLIKLHESSEDQ